MNNKKKYYGMHVGIVVQNNDPDNSGKAKVYIPHLHDVYEKWYDVKIDKKFKFLGKNIDGDLDVILDTLKENLPWAERASPLASQDGSGRYNAFYERGTISDSNEIDTTESREDYIPSKYALNRDGIGEKPGYKYETDKLTLKDAFTSTDEGELTGVKRPNKFAVCYKPSTYSNLAKGSFGVPNVGAHVWVFFKDGNISFPVYFASAFNDDAWQGIYDSTNDQKGSDYPGAYENADKDKSSSSFHTNDNLATYRNKYVINQKGGVLEFINTDKREGIKLTHYSGSFKGFDNYTNTELAVNNDQKLVLRDQYLTVNGHRSIFTARDLDYIVRGDYYRRVGNQNVEAHEEWRRIVEQLAKVKEMFEIQRVQYSTGDMFSSPDQIQAGTYAPCPVCNTNSTRAQLLYQISNTFGSVGIPIRKFKEDGPPNKETIAWGKRETATRSKFGSTNGKTIFGETCPVCNGSGLSPSSMDGIWTLEPKKEEENWKKLIKQAQLDLIEVEKELGVGGSEIVNITKHKMETIGTVMNDFVSIRIDKKGKMYRNAVTIHEEGVFNSSKESPLVEYVHVDELPGGSYTLNICNKWNIQVGAGGIGMKSYGPVDIGGTIVNLAGEQVNIGSRNEVTIDGGKRLELVADIVSIRQRKNQQVLIDSNLGVSQNAIIGGGMHVEGELTVQHVTAPVEIQETEKTEIWGKAEWQHKKIIGYLDNGVIPLTGPYSASGSPGSAGYNFGKGMKMGPTPIYSKLGWEDEYGGGGKGPPIENSPRGVTFKPEGYEADHDSIRMYPHSHHFKNLPLHLKKTNDGVRKTAKNCHFSTRIRAEKPDFRMAKDKVS